MADGQEKQCAFDGCTKEALFQEDYCWEHLLGDRKRAFKKKIETAKRDLRGANLRGADLSGIDLEEANLIGAILTEADLSKAVLHAADLSNASLSGANLQKAQVLDAELKEANLQRAHLVGVDLSYSGLAHADLRGANMRGADLSETTLVEARLEKAVLSNADLSLADMRQAYLRQTNLSGANLTGARIADARFWAIRSYKKARFTGVDPSRASWVGSPGLKRYVEDEIFLQDFRQEHPGIYWMWRVLCDCGRNVLLWLLWCVFFVTLFGGFFLLSINDFNIRTTDTIFTPYYFSIVTFTTLGFGDVTPMTLAAQILVALEVIFGYVMLGVLVSFLAVHLMRRG